MQLDEGSRNPIRVVVVSEEILERLRPFPSLLRRANVRFLLAYSGSEALTLAGASDPALLLGTIELVFDIRARRCAQALTSAEGAEENPPA